MALKIYTTIRNVHQAEWGDEEWMAELLKPIEECQAPVEVLCEATDGYFDILLPSGETLPAISAFHLVGFTFDGQIDFDQLGVHKS